MRADDNRLSRRAAVRLLACGATGGFAGALAATPAFARVIGASAGMSVHADANANASADGGALANAVANADPRAQGDARPGRSEATLDLSRWLQPIPRSARFDDPGYYVWCGSVVRGRDGRYHLFYSRWPLARGFHSWVTHSEIARAVADSPLGPFKHADVVLPARGASHWDGLCTHNPTVHRFGDRYFLYYMGNTGDGIVAAPATLNWTHRNNQRIGVAVADAPEGPWRRRDTPLIAPTDGFHDALCCTNPTIAYRPTGAHWPAVAHQPAGARRAAEDYLMIYKAVGRERPLPFGGPVVHIAAVGASPEGPFVKQPRPLFTSAGSDFPAEDPFIWTDRTDRADRTGGTDETGGTGGTDGGRVRAIVKDMAGAFTHRGRSLALFESADGGLDWTPATHPLVSGLELRWADGQTQRVEYLERPQLLIEDGRPCVLYLAVRPMDAALPTFNVHVPLKESDRP